MFDISRVNFYFIQIFSNNNKQHYYIKTFNNFFRFVYIHALLAIYPGNTTTSIHTQLKYRNEMK